MSLCTYLMSPNKYGCHTANMSHTAIMLYGHRDAKIQATSICISCCCHVYATCPNCSICISGGEVYATHVLSDINHVGTSAVHKKTMIPSLTMKMIQPSCICPVGQERKLLTISLFMTIISSKSVNF